MEQEDENFEGRHLTANNDDEDSEKSEDEGSRDRFRSERTNNSVPKKYMPNNPPNALGLLELIWNTKIDRLCSIASVNGVLILAF